MQGLENCQGAIVMMVIKSSFNNDGSMYMQAKKYTVESLYSTTKFVHSIRT